MLTASEMGLIITPKTLKAAANGEARAHVWNLLSQRITGRVEPTWVSADMLRGDIEEVEARRLYSKQIAPAKRMGFVVNTRYGFPIGFSPDGLVGEDGFIEVKSRLPKFQVQTIAEHIGEDAPETPIPPEFIIQVQTGLIVTERAWCDFITYSGGLPAGIIRVFPDLKVQEAILEAAKGFEETLAGKHALYRKALEKPARLYPTERTQMEGMVP